jgi:hypothetical protein
MRSLGILALSIAALAQPPHLVEVFLFVRTDCPITNRYAPELRRIATEFQGRRVAFYLVYPDPTENKRAIENHLAEFQFPGTPLRDPDHELEKRSHATTAPEAAVFDGAGHLKYHGRIDNLWISPGTARPAATVHDLEDAISAVLAGKPIAHPETRAIGCSLSDSH